MQYFNSCKLSSEIAAVTIQKLGFRLHTLGIYERDNTFLCSEVLNCDDGITLMWEDKAVFLCLPVALNSQIYSRILDTNLLGSTSIINFIWIIFFVFYIRIVATF